MILTQCAVCATELGLTLGKKCGRCSTRYCGPECQKQHWEEGGHDQLCKKIKKAGGAEQYNANEKYSEAVSVAAEACAEDTKGQTCYICTQALHWKTKEGLVRGCSCRGTAGFAHVSCLAEQAKVVVTEAEENNWDDDRFMLRWNRWNACSLCEQEYHGVVSCALGWACWKTYVGRSETDEARHMAMTVLGNGLYSARRYEDASNVYKVDLSELRRIGASENRVLIAQGNLAITYEHLGRLKEALRLKRDVYSGSLRFFGEEAPDTLREANNYAAALHVSQRFKEAKSLLRRTLPVARRVLGESHQITLGMKSNYAAVLYADPDAMLDDLREAVTLLEVTDRTARRVLGGVHPLTSFIERDLRRARDRLAARDGGDVSSVCDGVAAMTPGDA